MMQGTEPLEGAIVLDDEFSEWPLALQRAIEAGDDCSGRNEIALEGQTMQSTSAAVQGRRPYGKCVKNAEPRWMSLQGPNPKDVSQPISAKDRYSIIRQSTWEKPFGPKVTSEALPQAADAPMFGAKFYQLEEDDGTFPMLLQGIVSNLQNVIKAVRRMEDWHKSRGGYDLRSSEVLSSRMSGDSVVGSYHLIGDRKSMGVGSQGFPMELARHRHDDPSSPKTALAYNHQLTAATATSTDVVSRRGSLLGAASRRPSLNISAMKFQLRGHWEIEDEDGGPAAYEVEAVCVDYHASPHKRQLRRGRTTRDMVETSKMVLHPYSCFRFVWNILCLLAIFYDIFAIPLQAFANTLPQGVDATMRVMDWLLATMWTLDVMISARTGFFHKALLNMDPDVIAKHYCRTWMMPDLVMVCLSWYSVATDELTRFGNIFRARAFYTLRVLRLGRIWKVHALMRMVEDQINTNLFHLCFGLIKLTTILVIAVHVVTCVWYAIGSSQAGWTSYYESPVGGARDFYFWYFASSRWTLAQINGRTDIEERRTIQELYYTCAVAILFAVIFMSIFISSITTTMVELSAAAEAETSTRRLMNEYMSYYQVPMVLVGSVKRHLRDMTFQDDQQREQRLLEKLPRQLASDLLYEIHSPVLMIAPFFQELDTDCPRVMRHLCYGVVSSVAVHKWEIIFDLGDSCSRMLVIRKGELMYSNDHTCRDFWSPDYQDPDAPAPPGEALHKGSWLCEAALWMEWVNHGRLIAAAQSSLLSLDSKKFADLVQDYKDAHLLAAGYARSFLIAIKREEHISDLFAVKISPTPRQSFESETSGGVPWVNTASHLGSAQVQRVISGVKRNFSAGRDWAARVSMQSRDSRNSKGADESQGGHMGKTESMATES